MQVLVFSDRSIPGPVIKWSAILAALSGSKEFHREKLLGGF
jgi:hypothetical protein